jgi:hypothetical protein
MVVVDLPPPEACALARQLRENEGTRPTAIVALSRTPRPDAEIELRDAGVNVVIPVPLDPFLWDRRLEELLCVPARRGQRIPVRLRDWSRFVSDADEDEGVVNIGARVCSRLAPPRARDEGRPELSLRRPAPVAGRPGRRPSAGEQTVARVGVEFLVYRATRASGSRPS